MKGLAIKSLSRLPNLRLLIKCLNQLIGVFCSLSPVVDRLPPIIELDSYISKLYQDFFFIAQLEQIR